MAITILSRLSGAFEGAMPSPMHYLGLALIAVVFIIHFFKVLKKS
jgi:hypothetical protein